MSAVMETSVMETNVLATTVIATLDDLSKEALHKLYSTLCERLEFYNLQNFALVSQITFLEGHVSYLNDQIELRDLSLPSEKSNSYEEGFIDGQHCALESPKESPNESPKEYIEETIGIVFGKTLEETIEIVVIKTQEEKVNNISEKPKSHVRWSNPLLEQIKSDDDSTVVSEISTIEEIEEYDSESETYSEMASAIEDEFQPVRGKNFKSPSDKILNSLVDERAKDAFISTEKFVLEKLKNTNINEGLFKWVCENQSVPKEHFASLSCYHVKHNPTFDEKFWRKTDGTISNFADIFNKRNPKFFLKLTGKGHAATFERF
jgi:hypothetical protein